MPRAAWTGFLSFGLVSVPVGLFTSTEDKSISFNQFEEGTSDRIRYKKVNGRTGEEVPSDKIVKGFDLGGDEFVIVTPEELKNVSPGKSETIEISDFVDLDDIDPIYFQKAYYVAPRGNGADKVYALLKQAMAETNKVGIASLVMRDKEYLVAVRPAKDALMLEVMYFADEVKTPQEAMEQLPKDGEFEGRELDVAKQLIEALATKWEPENYHSASRERVEALIEQKRLGHIVVADEQERPRANIVDLMSALQQSIERSRTKSTAPATKEPAREQASAAQQSFEGMTKAGLLEQATKLDVKGRSKMTREELIDAVKAAEGPRRREAS